MKLQKKLSASPKRWLVAITPAVMLTVLAASGCGSSSSPGGSSGGGSTSGGSSSTAGSLTQWAQQYGGDVMALLNAASFDEGQIWSSGSCSDTPTAVRVLERDPPPPNAKIALQLATGETELSLAADSCSTVQQFIFGTRDVGQVAQQLGLLSGS